MTTNNVPSIIGDSKIALSKDNRVYTPILELESIVKMFKWCREEYKRANTILGKKRADKYLLLIYLLLFSGARNQEIASIKKCDIEQVSNGLCIYFRTEKSKQTGVRTMFIEDTEIIRIITNICDNLPNKTDYIIQNDRHKKLTDRGVGYVFDYVATKAGVQTIVKTNENYKRTQYKKTYHPHACRSLVITLATLGGHPTSEIASAIGITEKTVERAYNKIKQDPKLKGIMLSKITNNIYGKLIEEDNKQK